VENFDAMNLNLQSFKIFTYRNLAPPLVFNLNEDFLFALTPSGITQIRRGTHKSLSYPISIHPIHFLASKDFLFIATAHALYHFDSACTRIMDREPLSRDFISSSGTVCNVSSSRISLFNPCTKQVCQETALASDNGLCICISELPRDMMPRNGAGTEDASSRARPLFPAALLLGFENGRFYTFDMGTVKLYKELKESLIFAEANAGFLFAITIDSRLLRINIDDLDSRCCHSPGPADITTNGPADITTNGPADITTNGPADITTNGPADITTNGPADITTNGPADITTNGPADSPIGINNVRSAKPPSHDNQRITLHIDGKDLIYTKCPENSFKLLFYKNLVIYFYRNAVLYFSAQLRLLGHSREFFTIVDAYIVSNELHLGYENGLIVSFDIEGLLRHIIAELNSAN